MRPVCMDMTRLVRRAHLDAPTGIDRVERAYLDHFLATDAELFAILRDGRRMMLLDPETTRRLALRLGRHDAPPPLARSLRHRLSRHSRWPLVEALRDEAAGWIPGQAVLPAGAAYVNVGHSNWSGAGFAALRRAGAARILVMIHDTIPLDLPALQPAGTPGRFRKGFDAALAAADAILAPSAAAAAAIARNAPARAGKIAVHVAPPGVTPPAPDPPSDTADDPAPPGPCFVTVGTIEPRKNHALLLDLWETLPAPRPTLYVVGRRGWLNAPVFRRLDRGIDGVRETGALCDAALARLLGRASGLLHPSVAEGFGFPPHEAAAMGLGVVCAPLPVYGEHLRGAALYAGHGDLPAWRQAVETLMDRPAPKTPQALTSNREEGFHPPQWAAHFKTALTTIC